MLYNHVSMVNLLSPRDPLLVHTLLKPAVLNNRKLYKIWKTVAISHNYELTLCIKAMEYIA